MEEKEALKLYTSIHKLPLYAFIDVMTNDNYSALVVAGVPSESDLPELHATWNSLYDQYAEAMGNQETVYYLEKYKQAILLSGTHTEVWALTSLLKACNERKIFSKEVCDNLNHSLHSNLPFSETDFTVNEQSLQRAIRLNKGIKLKADMAEAEFNDLNKKEEGKKPDEAYYQKVLINLSDHAGFAITNTITTYEYCERVRRLNIYIKENNNRYGRR